MGASLEKLLIGVKLKVKERTVITLVSDETRSCAKRWIRVSLCDECAGSVLERNFTLTSGAALARAPLCASF